MMRGPFLNPVRHIFPGSGIKRGQEETEGIAVFNSLSFPCTCFVDVPKRL